MEETIRDSQPEQAREEDTPRGRPRVLVVDDDVTVRSLAELHLGEAGFDVITLAEGERVVETVRAARPDVVLLDVVLPDRDGFGLCRDLRRLPGADHLPIAMLTSRDDEEAIRSSFEAGATEFLPKPINWLHETYRLRYLLRAAATMHELRAAREAVAQGKAEWEQTFDAIDDPVMVMGPDLTILRANQAAARFTRLSVEELVGRACDEVHACSRPAAGSCPVRRAAAQGAPVHEEMRGFGLDQRDCLVTASPVMDAGRSTTAVVFSIKDVTVYRELERELLHAQKMEALGVLAAGIAHDFNNLLQGIVGFAELLSMGVRSPAEIEDGLKEIARIAANGRELTRRLLLTSRKGSTALGPVTVGPIVEEVAELLRRTAPKTITMEASSPPGLWPVKGEAGLLHQGITNLAINAMHAMPEGGILSIRAENATIDDAYARTHPDCQPGPHVVISVADTGCGMDQTTLGKMYEPFFTTKGPAQGTGLGLSVVYGIVRHHGGHISCYSELGEGTTFRVFLPAIVDESLHEIAEEAGQSGRSILGRGRTVLVVDDEPAIRGLVQQHLVEHGYRVLTASNGREALHRIDADSAAIEAVLLDINMPEMDGETCLTELAGRGCRIPVVLATGALLDVQRQERLLRDAAGIIMKPFEMKKLLRALADVLEPREGGLSGTDEDRRARLP